MKYTADVIVIGAGSVGVPSAMALAKEKLKVIVIDSLPSSGQGNNKKAIGGIRATHSDFGKIKICQRSIEIFSTWKEMHGDDIGWLKNGYSYPAYSEEDEKKLKDLLNIQQKFGLNIGWVTPQEYEELVPGISRKNLLGSTYSPDDGSASPLTAVNAFYFKSLQYGAHYRFQEKVLDIRRETEGDWSIQTDKGKYSAPFVIHASGNGAKVIAGLVGQDIPVHPDCHEGAITEPVQRFFGPMIVDMRPASDSLNYYFYQNAEGQVVFCITPNPSIWGEDNDSTSLFFPQVAKRMISLYPRLAKLKVRRSWRGQYPMTPDGFPIVGTLGGMENFVHAVGMCGQGFMLGPGLGELLTRMVKKELHPEDSRILESFSPTRSFSGMEAFK